MATSTPTKLIPAPSPEVSLSRYLQDIRKFPMLEPQEEYMLAKRWNEHEDSEADNTMVTRHLRLVAKIGMGYRRAGLHNGDGFYEGNVGLMQDMKERTAGVERG